MFGSFGRFVNRERFDLGTFYCQKSSPDVMLTVFLRLAMAGRLYNVHANQTSNSGFDRTFMPCSGYFYLLPNNERGTN